MEMKEQIKCRSESSIPWLPFTGGRKSLKKREKSKQDYGLETLLSDDFHHYNDNELLLYMVQHSLSPHFDRNTKTNHSNNRSIRGELQEKGRRKQSNNFQRKWQKLMKPKENKKDITPDKNNNKSILKKKRIISFFDDPNTNESNINSSSIKLQRLSYIKSDPNEVEKIPSGEHVKNRNNKFIEEDIQPKHNVMSKFTTYKNVSNRDGIQNKTFPFEERSKNPNEIYHEDDLTVMSTEEIYNVSPKDGDGGFKKVEIMQTESPPSNEDRKACIETYWNQTDMRFRFISKVFDVLPPSKKVFEEFVQATRLKKTTVTKVKTGKRVEKNFTHCEMKSSTDSLHSDDSYLMSSAQSPVDSRAFKPEEKENKHKVPLENFMEELCPDTLNLIKLAISKEITKRWAYDENTRSGDIPLEEFERLVQEHVSNIIAEIMKGHDLRGDMNNVVSNSKILNNKECKFINISNGVEKARNEGNISFSSLKNKRRNHYLSEENINQKTMTPHLEKVDRGAVDYNKALKQFEQNLLRSDSDCSLVSRKRHDTIRHQSISRNVSRNKRMRRETVSRCSRKSMDRKYQTGESFMKIRKQEVEEKLREYSRKRTQSLHKKKPMDTNARIKEIAHQKITRHGTRSTGNKYLEMKIPEEQFFVSTRKKGSLPAQFKSRPRKPSSQSKRKDGLFKCKSSFLYRNNEIEISNLNNDNNKNNNGEAFVVSKDTVKWKNPESSSTEKCYQELPKSVSGLSAIPKTMTEGDSTIPTIEEKVRDIYTKCEDSKEKQTGPVRKHGGKSSVSRRKPAIRNLPRVNSQSSFVNGGSRVALTWSDEIILRKALRARKDQIMKVRGKRRTMNGLRDKHY